MANLETYSTVQTLCNKIVHNPKDFESITQLQLIVNKSSASFAKVIKISVLSSCYNIIKLTAQKKSSYTINEKILIMNFLREILEKCTIDKENLFFNFYSFLLFEIYDHEKYLILPICEEYKLAIINCMISLANSVSSDLIFEIYKKENVGKYCQMLYAAIEIAKQEKLKALRIAAIECLLAIARVLKDEDFNDIVVRNQISEVFLYFLPGIASSLKNIALEDQKYGHKVPLMAIKAWGKLVVLFMESYEAYDENLNFESITEEETSLKTAKISNGNDMKKYLQNTKRNYKWYKATDKKMHVLVLEFSKLINHPHYKIRLELAVMCSLLIEHCIRTMPTSISHIIEIVICLSEDENTEVSILCKNILKNISQKFTTLGFKRLFENLEEGFYNNINSLPRKFNGIDENEQHTSINLIIGYIKLFGEHNLNNVFLSPGLLDKLLSTLLHILEFDNRNVSLMEEFISEDLEVTTNIRTSWKTFKLIKDELLIQKLEYLCSLFGKLGAHEVVSDFLLDTFLYQPEERKAATFIINNVILGIEDTTCHQIIKNVLETYINKENWNLSDTTIDENGYEYSLSEIQSNIIQICLCLEGIGIIAQVLKNQYDKYMLKTLYLVLERAGSGQTLLNAAGVATLKKITNALGYQNIMELIIKNVDYISYNIEKKIRKIEENGNVLNVISVILKYSTVDTLHYIADIIEEVLVQSCDKLKQKNYTLYLKVFKTFVHSLCKWLDIKPVRNPFKSKIEKEKEIEDFYVTGIKTEENLHEEIEEKSAEEMFKEDMEKKNEELEEEVEEYKKPESPLHITLTVNVLRKSLHFLPSKDKVNKLLALEILSYGLEIIRDWEDDLLPIVHQIWSPLVERFKDYENPLIINYSFNLLTVLARLSKDFIRMRTQKDIFSNILELLKILSKESFLKDKGSSYRYTQKYKLQVMILSNLAYVIIDLDLLDKHIIEAIDCVFLYLNQKQPVPLQEAATEFYILLWKYDPKLLKPKFKIWLKDEECDYSKNVFNIYNLCENI